MLISVNVFLFVGDFEYIFGFKYAMCSFGRRSHKAVSGLLVFRKVLELCSISRYQQRNSLSLILFKVLIIFFVRFSCQRKKG